MSVPTPSRESEVLDVQTWLSWSRCSRCGAITGRPARLSPGKCALFVGDTTHSPHDWQPVRLTVTVESA